jgi:hypothetical protein
MLLTRAAVCGTVFGQIFACFTHGCSGHSRFYMRDVRMFYAGSIWAQIRIPHAKRVKTHLSVPNMLHQKSVVISNSGVYISDAHRPEHR